MKKPKEKKRCDYCYGYGIYKGYWDRGQMRRPMERGPNATPAFPDIPVYACDRCGNPKGATPPPLKT